MTAGRSLATPPRAHSLPPDTKRAAARNTFRAIAALFALSVLASFALGVCQRMIGQSVFEWGTVKTFPGIFQTKPYPHLLVPRPGEATALPQFSTYYLVAPWKFGLN